MNTARTTPLADPEVALPRSSAAGAAGTSCLRLLWVGCRLPYAHWVGTRRSQGLTEGNYSKIRTTLSIGSDNEPAFVSETVQTLLKF